MFWILGAGCRHLWPARVSADNAATVSWRTSSKHKDWQGFAFYDLIFPLFVFIVGVSLASR